MLAKLRDHATSGMMVLGVRGVECSAKIAMTALLDRLATTRLLPEHVLPWRIFPDAHSGRIRSS
jgi:hypothetical protein